MSCSNQTKLGMDYHHCSQSAKKEILVYFAWEKRNFSYGNLRISRLANFKNRSFSSGQGVVQIEQKSVWSLAILVRV